MASYEWLDNCKAGHNWTAATKKKTETQKIENTTAVVNLTVEAQSCQLVLTFFGLYNKMAKWQNGKMAVQ